VSKAFTQSNEEFAANPPAHSFAEQKDTSGVNASQSLTTSADQHQDWKAPSISASGKPENSARTIYPRANPATALPKTIHRVRVLDESAILPNEASFATVDLYQKTVHSYSPATEFVTKLGIGVKRSFSALLLLAVCGGVVFLFLKLNGGAIFDSPRGPGISAVSSSGAQLKSLPAQKQVEVAAPVIPQPVLDTQAQTVNPTSPLIANQVTAQVIERRDSRTLKNRRERSTTAEQTTDSTPPKSVATPGIAVRPKTGSTESTPSAVPEKRTATPTAESGPKSEAESKTLPTGGGERPRRVKAQTDSPRTPSGTSSDKPKVIDWP